MSDQRYVTFTVRGLALDPDSRLPILLLQDPGGRVLLPIWIGAFEAGAIATRLEGRTFPRPMTHDLLFNVVTALGAEVLHLDIRALKGGTFYGSLHLRAADGRRHAIDCRPSDGVAVAVRAEAPIRVAADVLEAAQPLQEEGQGADEEGGEAPRVAFVAAGDEAARARLAEQLADMDPEDFGKYEM
ncbi:MAG: bifunctional nuclease family protein [Myxococcales bacterium]|nr:bifunctional nuclease family protein [Myxococcales bacterium]